MRVECEDLRGPNVIQKVEQGSFDRDNKNGDGEVPAVSEQFTETIRCMMRNSIHTQTCKTHW